MFCEHCGNKLHEDAVVCMKCGCQVKNKNNNTIAKNEDDGKANTLCIISLALIFGGPIINYLLNLMIGTNKSIGILGSAASTAAFVLMIIARVKYPNNTFAKVLMWIYIALAVIGIILVIIAIVFLAGALHSLIN